MDTQPGFDRSLFIPIFLSGCSIVGIVVVLLIGRSLSSPPEVPVTPSPTRFQYLYLGTEPAIATPIVEETEIVPTEELIEAPTEPPPVFSTPTPPGIGTPVILTQPNTTRTPTSVGQQTSTPTRFVTATQTNTPGPANSYDDTDSRLTYTGNWVSQTGVNGAYMETLHVSDAAGSSMTFSFTGQDIQLHYQAGLSLGVVTITFDNETLGTQVSQAQGGVWVYRLDTAGTHRVFITHTSGGSVNIDRLVIPAATPTPTRTATTQG